MSLTAIAQKVRAKQLIPRLDACAARIDEGGIVIEHAAVYAAFLSDVVAERIDVSKPEAAGMLNLVDEFCDLVEQEYPTVN